MAQDTRHASPHSERAHQLTGAKWATARHTQHNTASAHTGKQEPSGPNTAHATQCEEQAHR